MARYVIGDVQGCYTELQLLLSKIRYNSTYDRLYLVGDLVNRGPESLEVLRWAKQESAHVETVLGNHDLHLLAVYWGCAALRTGDTLEAVLAAADAPELLDWLRCQPLLISFDDVVIAHAGILPAWDEMTARMLADEVAQVLSGPECRWFLSQMYGNKPRLWRDGLNRLERLRLTVNAFTRMRLVDAEGALDFKFKGELEKAPADLMPWYAFPQRQLIGKRIVCGHWSALGLLLRDDVCSLDTGCVWGGKLSALRLEDGALFQVDAQRIHQVVVE